MPLTVQDFITKWSRVELTERSAAQQHFLDLCDLIGHPKPAAVDPSGDSFTFERSAAKTRGGDGWADVWKKGFFAWEYKGKHKDLTAAYDQLLQYSENLENPPLLVVCDMDRILVHTRFTAMPTTVHEITTANLDDPRRLEVLRAVFHDPERLRPGVTSAAITEKAASSFAGIAESMRRRGLDPQAVARFLDRVVFCLFAEAVDLLPGGLFSRLLQSAGDDPVQFRDLVAGLFRTMATGGFFGTDRIRHFDGNLFDAAEALVLTRNELVLIRHAARSDWGGVAPSILGTLFERGLDPGQRAQIGAHYTGEADIGALVEPVVMQPLRREWETVKTTVESLLATGVKPGVPAPGGARRPPAKTMEKARGEAEWLTRRFLERLTRVRVLDPACGSGNFLYVALRQLKDLEKAVIVFAKDRGLADVWPAVNPRQLYGIEVNAYAYELAQMSIWIGYLQWIKVNGYGAPEEPILKPMTGNFQCRDAILDLTDPANLQEPEWPSVDFIVGNPPFLGGKLLRRNLGDSYVERLYRCWEGRVPHEADLCCYWFEKARQQLADGKCWRAGLLATQAIRGGANREVLKRVKETGGIFFAESDRPWVLAGANVHVSMVGFDDGSETQRVLDGRTVPAISANLAHAIDITAARGLAENQGLAWMGDTKGGAFDIDGEAALRFLTEPNPHARPNSDVLVPWLNGADVTRRGRGKWVIDFGIGMSLEEAARFDGPFAVVQKQVKPVRDTNRRESYRRLWWQHMEARPEMRAALAPLPRFLATTTVSKHRLFVWLRPPTLPDHQLIVFARADDYFSGVLHSRLHQVWALAQGTQLRERASGFRYTPTTCFETFPFPWPLGAEPAGGDPRVEAIAAAAHELDELRSRWLNPPEWTCTEYLEFPATPGGPWDRYIVRPQPAGEPGGPIGSVPHVLLIGESPPTPWGMPAVDAAPNATGTPVATARYPRLVPRDAESATKLAKRSLTGLYNERPAWLELAHRRLDEAVFTAYGWRADLPDSGILDHLLALNLGRAEAD